VSEEHSWRKPNEELSDSIKTSVCDKDDNISDWDSGRPTITNAEGNDKESWVSPDEIQCHASVRGSGEYLAHSHTNPHSSPPPGFGFSISPPPPTPPFYAPHPIGFHHMPPPMLVHAQGPPANGFQMPAMLSRSQMTVMSGHMRGGMRRHRAGMASRGGASGRFGAHHQSRSININHIRNIQQAQQQMLRSYSESVVPPGPVSASHPDLGQWPTKPSNKMQNLGNKTVQDPLRSVMQTTAPSSKQSVDVNHWPTGQVQPNGHDKPSINSSRAVGSSLLEETKGLRIEDTEQRVLKPDETSHDNSGSSNDKENRNEQKSSDRGALKKSNFKSADSKETTGHVQHGLVSNLPFLSPVSEKERERLLKQQFEDLHSMSDFANLPDTRATESERQDPPGAAEDWPFTNKQESTAAAARRGRRRGPTGNAAQQIAFLRSLGNHADEAGKQAPANYVPETLSSNRRSFRGRGRRNSSGRRGRKNVSPSFEGPLTRRGPCTRGRLLSRYTGSSDSGQTGAQTKPIELGEDQAETQTTLEANA